MNRKQGKRNEQAIDDLYNHIPVNQVTYRPPPSAPVDTVTYHFLP